MDTTRLNTFLNERLPAALEMLRRMVEINSYTGNREGVNRVGRLTAEYFGSLGFTAEFIASANSQYGDHLVLNRSGSGPNCIAMISHLDTVFTAEEEARNNFRWLPDGDRIYGPGTHDIKGGTMVMFLVLAALHELARQDLDQTTWKLLFNSSEETLSPDFGELCRSRFDASTLAALVVESEGRFGEERLVVVARKARITWRIRAIGRAAHAGAQHRLGANAIVQLAQVAERIAALTDYSKDLTFNPALVFGGSTHNRVPHEAVLEGEFRAFSNETFVSAKAALLAFAGPGEVRSCADRFPCHLEVEILSETPAWPRNPASDYLAELWRRAGQRLGLPVNVQERGGLSDGNLIWDAVPTLDGLGPWGDNDHCSERSVDGTKVPEYVDVPSIVPKAMLNTIAILDLIRSAKRPPDPRSAL